MKGISLILSIVPPLAALAPDRALGWLLPSPVVETSEDSLDPRLAVDSSGMAHATWRERTGGTVFRIWYTTDAPGFFVTPGEVSQSGPAASYAPALAADGADVHVVWASDQTGDNFEVWYRGKTAGGWGAIYNASNTPIKSLRPAVSARGAVGPVIAWDEAVCGDDNYETFFSDWNGSGFNPAINISNTPGGSVYGSVNVNVVVTPDGDLTVVWADRITGDYHVNARRRVGGTWQPRQQLSSLKTGPATPGLATGADSRVHVIYEAEGAIRHQQWNGVSWTAPAALPGGLSSGIRPRIAVDGEGVVHVTADAFTDAQNNRDIFYTNNAGGAWNAWANLSNTPGTQSLNSDIGCGAGRIVVTWQENSDGQGSTGVFNVWHTATAPPPIGPTGTIAGTVQDSLGHPVAGAVVTAGAYYQTVSASGGSYALSGIPVGLHDVTASKAYYTGQTVHDVAVTAGATTVVDFTIVPDPPGPVVSFSVEAANTSNKLTWTNPSTGNFSGTMIRVKNSGFPTDPADGTLVVDKPASPGSSDSYTHAGLTNGVAYYYTAFAHTDNPVYASGVTAMGTPFGPGDWDHDGDVDQEDFGFFQICLSGSFTPPQAGCEAADLDQDDDVDEEDVAIFRNCLSGAGIPADPQCDAL